MAEDMLVVLVLDPNSPPSDVFLAFGFAVLALVPLLVALFLRLAVVVSYKLGMGLYFTRPSRKLVIVMSTFLVVTGYCICECEVESERERERERECVSMFVRRREAESVYVCVMEGGRVCVYEGECVCV